MLTIMKSYETTIENRTQEKPTNTVDDPSVLISTAILHAGIVVVARTNPENSAMLGHTRMQRQDGRHLAVRVFAAIVT